MPTAERDRLKQEWSVFVRELMRRKGWTLEVLARKLGCTSATVSRWSSGHGEKGRIPRGTSAKVLVELAQHEGLVD